MVKKIKVTPVEPVIEPVIESVIEPVEVTDKIEISNEELQEMEKNDIEIINKVITAEDETEIKKIVDIVSKTVVEDVPEVTPEKTKSYNQIACPKCNKYMSSRTLKYTHEKVCQPDKPQKPKTKKTNTEEIVRMKSDLSKINKALVVKEKEESYIKPEITEEEKEKVKKDKVIKNTVKFTSSNVIEPDVVPVVKKPDIRQIKADKMKKLISSAF